MALEDRTLKICNCNKTMALDPLAVERHGLVAVADLEGAVFERHFSGLFIRLRLRRSLGLGFGGCGSFGRRLALDAALLLLLLFLFLFVEQQALRVLQGLQHRWRDRLALRVVLAVRLELLEGLEVGILEQLLERRTPHPLVD